MGHEDGPSASNSAEGPVSYQKFLDSQYLKDLRNAEAEIAQFADTLAERLGKIEQIADTAEMIAELKSLVGLINVFAADHREAPIPVELFGEVGDKMLRAGDYLKYGAIAPAKEQIRRGAYQLAETLAKAYFTPPE